MHPTFVRPRFQLLLSPETAGSEDILSLPDLVRFSAEHNPYSLFLLQALDASQDKSVDKRSLSITYLSFYASTLRCRQNLADGLKSHRTPLGSSAKPAPVALLLESDARSLLYLTSLLWLGVPCLLLSPRLAPNAVNHLLRETEVQAVIVSKRTCPLAQSALDIDQDNPTASPKATLIHASSLEDCFSSVSSSQPNPAEIRADVVQVDEADCNVLILHSSGTTGLPKPIGFPHRYLLGYAACHAFSEADDCSGINVSTLPLFHGFGLLAPCLALSVGMPCCLPHPTVLPTGSSTLALIRSASAASLMTVPSILEDLVADLDSRGSPQADCSAMAALGFVAVGGGAMTNHLGQRLADMGIRLLNHYGVTEIGALAPIFFPDAAYDWKYLRLRRDLGLKLRPTTNTADAASQVARFRISGIPFGRQGSFEVQDDLECNPLQPETEVRILGRTDDLIVLASGEKVRPTLLEQAVLTCPLVRSAIVLGSGKFELVIMVEPARPLENDVPNTEQHFIDAVWPFVLQGNSTMDAHAQITSKKAVIVKPHHKTIPRTPKGSIMRKETHVEFAEEIENAHRLLGSQSDFFLDYSDLEESLKMLVKSCLPSHAHQREWAVHDNLFELGIDSLQAIRLQRILEASITKANGAVSGKSVLPLNFVYSFETVAKMADAIRQPGVVAMESASREIVMRSLVDRYRTKTSALSAQQPQLDKHRVLLTGCTGSIGSHLLDRLCRDPSVDRIVCLVRAAGSTSSGPDGLSSEDGRKADHHDGHSAPIAAQEAVNQKYGIVLTSQEWSKIEFLQWRPGADRLGLDEESWVRVGHGLTHILHCAWPMDFQRSLQSFEPHIEVIRTLADLALLANEHRFGIVPRFVVLSSIAAVGHYPLTAAQPTVPEELTDDPLVTLPMGYAEAKWVCEQTLNTIARQHAGQVDAVMIRVGQITGSTKSAYWNPKEHLPALFRAGKQLGKLPSLEGDVSWLPVDVASDAILDLLFAPLSHPDREHGSMNIFHVENPIRRRWSDILPTVMRQMGLPDGSSIPFSDWCKLAIDGGVVDSLLQEFLLSHFVHMSTRLKLDTTKARAHSHTLRSVGAPSHELIGRYVGT